MAVTTTKTINWGGVLKGAAIVTAVVAVAVVGYWAVGALANSAAVTGFFADPTVHSILTSTANGLSTAWQWLGTQAVEFGGWLKSAWAALPETLGLSSSLSTSATANIAAVTSGASATKIAATVAATAAGVTAASVALPTLSNINYVDTHTIAAHQANMMGLHEAAHATQHLAADHTAETQERRWTDRFSKQVNFGNHAQAARASAPAAGVTSPKDSFAEQLAADSANLNQALSK